MAGARKDNKGRVLLKDKIHLFQRYYYPEKTRRGINEE